MRGEVDACILHNDKCTCISFSWQFYQRDDYLLIPPFHFRLIDVILSAEDGRGEQSILVKKEERLKFVMNRKFFNALGSLSFPIFGFETAWLALLE